MNLSQSDHFEGKEAYEHILKKKSEVANEVHGDELPGHLGALLDSIRDASALLLILWTISTVLGLLSSQIFLMFILFGMGLFVWKIVRSYWLASTKLERLHRVLKEERYEIEHNRAQEREELGALYEAKGFKGNLLEEALDVLMADDERLLKVMMEEEMGLNLENYEHPLKVAAGSALGVFATIFTLSLVQWFVPSIGMAVAAPITIALSGMFIAKSQKNEPLPAFVWNAGFAILTYGIVFFLGRWALSVFN